MPACPICGSPAKRGNKFCSRDCLREGYRRGVVTNGGLFKKGMTSLNK